MSESHEIPTSAWDSLPAQAKAIVTVGVPSVIAMYLVYVLAGNVAAGQKESLAAQKDTQNLLREHMSSMAQQTTDQAAILRVLRTNCVNQAKDNDARERCLR